MKRDKPASFGLPWKEQNVTIYKVNDNGRKKSIRGG
jgi:hypothetical protein